MYVCRKGKRTEITYPSETAGKLHTEEVKICAQVSSFPLVSLTCILFRSSVICIYLYFLCTSQIHVFVHVHASI